LNRVTLNDWQIQYRSLPFLGIDSFYLRFPFKNTYSRYTRIRFLIVVCIDVLRGNHTGQQNND
jgi:hypothetical protein